MPAPAGMQLACCWHAAAFRPKGLTCPPQPGTHSQPGPACACPKHTSNSHPNQHPHRHCRAYPCPNSLARVFSMKLARRCAHSLPRHEPANAAAVCAIASTRSDTQRHSRHLQRRCRACLHECMGQQDQNCLRTYDTEWLRAYEMSFCGLEELYGAGDLEGVSLRHCYADSVTAGDRAAQLGMRWLARKRVSVSSNIKTKKAANAAW